MSFTGNLEDLAIVDVIQLLHSARKSGTLTVNAGPKEARLVFESGFIISAQHADEGVQIGKILLGMNALTEPALDQALEKQRSAGENRKPLIGMLIESGLVDKETAFKGLEVLIELTIVEMVSWIRGTFTLDVDVADVSDEYRYFPEKLNRELILDTQMVLMDALRIYDEKKRDGEIVDQLFEDEPPPAVSAVAAKKAPPPAEAGAPVATGLSADDLGLGAVEQLETRIPEVFSGLQVFDPADIHRQALAQEADYLQAVQREELAVFLTEFSTSISIDEASQRSRQPRAVLLFSRDELLRHLLLTVCKHEGVLVFAVDSGATLASRVEQARSRGMQLLVVFDVPDEPEGEFSADSMSALRREFAERHPSLKLVQLVGLGDDRHTGQAYQDGVKTILPRPLAVNRAETFAAETIRFLEAFLAFAVGYFNEQGQHLLGRLNRQLAGLQTLAGPPETALALLQFVAEQFDRSLTLVVAKGELVSERGIGLTAEGGAAPAPKLRIPLDRPSVFRRAVETGEVFYGPCEDTLLRETLYATLGAPLRSHVLLLPMRSRGRTLSLTYADFGPVEPAAVAPEQFEILARQAGLILDNAFYRKQLQAK